MIRYAIAPKLGVGPLRFGMTRPESRRAMKLEASTFFRTPEDVYPADAYHDAALQVAFDPVERVELIELHESPAYEALLEGVDIHRSDPDELLRRLGSSVARSDGFDIPELGLRFFRPDGRPRVVAITVEKNTGRISPKMG